MFLCVGMIAYVSGGGGRVGWRAEGPEGRDDDGLEGLDLAAAEGAAGRGVQLLPAVEAAGADEVAAGLQLAVLVVLGADLAGGNIFS